MSRPRDLTVCYLLVDALATVCSTQPQRAAAGLKELTFGTFARAVDDATFWASAEERVAAARVRLALADLQWLDANDVLAITTLVRRGDARWSALVDAAAALATLLRSTVVRLEAPETTERAVRVVLEAVAPLQRLCVRWTRRPEESAGLEVVRVGRPLRRRYRAQVAAPTVAQAVAAFGLQGSAAVLGAGGSHVRGVDGGGFTADVPPDVAASIQRRRADDGVPRMRAVAAAADDGAR